MCTMELEGGRRSYKELEDNGIDYLFLQRVPHAPRGPCSQNYCLYSCTPELLKRITPEKPLDLSDEPRTVSW